jgi:hypothetical protein
MVVEQEMDEKWEVTESLILSDVLITVSISLAGCQDADGAWKKNFGYGESNPELPRPGLTLERR